jgi:glutathione S-transferase
MSSYKLTYFNGRGKGEIIRLILTQADVPFEDNRLSFEEFAKLKSKLPFLQVPIFEIDGKITLCQSLAIARHLARKYNLAGKTELEQVQVDMIVDCIQDTLNPIAPFFRFEQDPVKKAEMKRKYIEEQLPVFLTKLEAFLVANNSGDSFFVGDSVTWADLSLVRAHGALVLTVGLEQPFGKHPKLKALYERVIQLPRIAAYQAKLPVTEF